MLTMSFGLFICTVTVVEPPPGGGGGGGGIAVHPGVYVPWKPKSQGRTKTVQIVVKLPGGAPIRRSYTVSSTKADLIVRVTNMVNNTMNSIRVGVEGIKQAAAKVSAWFSVDQ